MERPRPVLLVEDDEGIRESMQVFLEIEGYDVITASDGRQALRALSDGAAPGLILLDLMMPIMNGWEFAEALKRTKHAAIPVVLLTASLDHSGAEQYGGVLRKPIDLDLLLETVRKWCGVMDDQ
jgi:CheY-like chemotaxis protein